jgi:hypothetical protein
MRRRSSRNTLRRATRRRDVLTKARRNTITSRLKGRNTKISSGGMSSLFPRVLRSSQWFVSIMRRWTHILMECWRRSELQVRRYQVCHSLNVGSRNSTVPVCLPLWGMMTTFITNNRPNDHRAYWFPNQQQVLVTCSTLFPQPQKIICIPASILLPLLRTSVAIYNMPSAVGLP